MKIKIKEPCDADWSRMKIGIQSRHCELCVKNVMDFTQMTRQEIIEYLFNNQNQSTCGRMIGGQIDFRIADFEAVIEGNRRKKGNQPFLVLSFAALAMMSCGNERSSCNDPVLGNIEISQPIDTSTIVNQPKDSTKIVPEIVEPILPIDIDHIAGGLTIETGEMEMIPDPEPIVEGLIKMVEPEQHQVMGKMIAPVIMGEPEMPIVNESTLDIAEKMPEYPEGMEALMDYLESEIKYPKKAIKKGIEGRVFVQFVVEKDGRITQSKILKGVEETMDNEALRVINEMPNWIPGENKGQKVRVNYTLPIKFVLK